MALETLVIGLDGADWSYLERADCPVLQGLAARGVSGRLISTIPPLSPAAWSSFITGKRPAGHGIFDWQVRRPGGGLLRPVTAQDRRGAPFWRYLNRAGRRVGVMGLPVTYPVGEADGFLLGGFDSPWGQEGCFHPPGLDQRLSEHLGERARVLYSFAHTTDDERLLEAEGEFADVFTEAALFLAEAHDVDCLVLNYMSLDHLNHAASRFETVLAGYRLLDEQVARLVGRWPQADVIILSDHGSKRVQGGFLVCEVLEELDLVRYREGPVETGRHNELLVRYLQGSLGLSGLGEKVLRRLARYCLDAMPASWREALWGWVRRQDPRVFHLHWNIDREGSVVDVSGGCDIQIYVDRQRAGERGLESHQVTGLMRERLAQVRQPEGESPLFAAFHGPEELPNGACRELAPDLIATLDGAPYTACLSYPMSKRAEVQGLFAYRDEFYAHLMKGTHAACGIYIGAGPSFARGVRGPEMDLHDIPLLILALQGVPIPEDFEGQLRPELLAAPPSATQAGRQATLAAQAPSAQAAEAETSEEVVNRLRSLGYID